MRITNRRAPFEYQLFDRIEAGISLLGTEVKSIQMGRADLTAAFVRVTNDGAILVNTNIPPFAGGAPEGYNPTRTRRLLLNKKELVALETKAKQQKLTIMPTKLYTKGRLVKVEIALAKPKRKFEKREAKRKKDIEREVVQEFKSMSKTKIKV